MTLNTAIILYLEMVENEMKRLRETLERFIELREHLQKMMKEEASKSERLSPFTHRYGKEASK